MPDVNYPDHLQIAKDAMYRASREGYGTVELIMHVAAGALNEATDNRDRVRRINDALAHPDRLVSDAVPQELSPTMQAVYRDAQRVLIAYLRILACGRHSYIRAAHPGAMVGQITFCQRCGVIRGEHPLAPATPQEVIHG